jgi:hypothetical protein
MMSVHWKIERFLREGRMAATTFGRLAAGDPRLVHDLRNGREPGDAMIARIENFLKDQENAR